MAIEKFPYIFKKFVMKSDFHMTHEEIIFELLLFDEFLAMRKSDFHMTHVEIIFKLLLFDNFLIIELFF